MTYSSPDTETGLELLIRPSPDKKFFIELSDICQKLIDAAGPRTPVGVIDSMLITISECIAKWPNLTVKLRVSDNIGSYVGYPVINDSNPVLATHSPRVTMSEKSRYDLTTAMFKRGMDQYSMGEVDFVNGRVQGFYSKLTSNITLGREALFDGVTGKHLAAAILHEVGHVLVYFVLNARATKTNYIMEVGAQTLLNCKTDYEKHAFWTTLVEVGGYDKALLELSKLPMSEPEYKLVVLEEAMRTPKHELGLNSLYSDASFEQLADQYVTAQGAGVYLDEFLDILRAKFGIQRKSGFKTAVSSIALGLTSIVGLGLPVLSTHIAANNYGSKSVLAGKFKYDNDVNRRRRIREDLIAELKLTDKSSPYYPQLLNNIQNMLKREESIPPLEQGFLYRAFMIMSKTGRNYSKDVKSQKEMEGLLNNSLFYTAARADRNEDTV